MSKVLPLDLKLYDLSAERSVLGTLLACPEMIPTARIQLSEEDFYCEEHRLLFSVLGRLFDLYGTSWDEVILQDFIRKEELESSLPFDWILSIFEEASPLATFETACSIVKEKSTQRKVLSIITHYALPSLKKGELNLPELINRLSDVLIESSVVESKSALTLINEFLSKLRRKEEEKDIFSAGFVSLEGIVDGIPLGSYVLVGARPRVGKTSFALNLALALQKRGKVEHSPVLFVSLEMGEVELTKRLISIVSGIPYKSAKNENISEEEIDKAAEKSLELTDQLKNLHILHKPAMDVYELEGQVVKHKIEHGVEVVIVDYLQLLRCRGQIGVTYEVLSQISQHLCTIARKHKVLLIALVQLSRETEKRADKRPTLADLKGSGQMEQDADVVLLLHREALYKKKPSADELKKLEVIVAKNRFGEVGIAELEFDGDTQRVSDPGIRSEIGVQSEALKEGGEEDEVPF